MPPFVRLFNWYISIIPYCLTKGEHFKAALPVRFFAIGHEKCLNREEYR